MAIQTRVVCFRVTPADFQRLCLAAEEDGVPMATLIRFAVSEWLALSEEEPPRQVTSLCPPACNTHRSARQ